jgi:Mg2+ and Co2+ transporter CorA
MDFFGKIKKVFLTHKRKGIKMKAAATAQEKVDTLKKRISEFDKQVSTIRDEITMKRQEAGIAMLEGCNTINLEDTIFRLESRMKTLESGSQAATNKLAEEIRNLETAKKTDATERIKEIRTSLDQTANILKKILEEALTSAQVFEGLLNEAWTLNNASSVPLSPLGSWIQHANPYDTVTHFDSVLGAMLKNLGECKPKNDA